MRRRLAVAALLTALAFGGCSEQAAPPDPATGVTEPQKMLDERAALAVAQKFDPAAPWRATYVPEYVYESKGVSARRPAWKVEAVHKFGNKTIVMVDAQTGEPFSVMEAEPPGFEADGLQMPGASEGWLLAQGKLWRSVDGGESWEPVSLPFLQGQIWFSDAQYGWALVSQGVAAGSMAVDILATQDGGETWSRVSAASPDFQGEGALPMGGLKNAIAFSDRALGWVVGESYAPGEAWVYQTGDEGRTWSKVNLPVPEAYAHVPLSADQPIVADGGVIIPVRAMLGERTQTLLFRSIDGWKSWERIAALEGSGPVAFAGMAHGWFWDGDALQATDDGGRTWRGIEKGQRIPNVSALAFGSERVGLAATAGGLMRTEDGGRTWQLIQFP